MAKHINGRSGQRGRLTVVLGLVGASVFGFWLGRGGPQSSALAQPPAKLPAIQPAAKTPPPQTPAKAAAPVPAAPSTEYSKRVVAYIYGNMEITREELGEYLIARFGVDKVNMMVNMRIIHEAARRRGLDVTAAEVDAEIARDCEALKVKKDEFIRAVLQQRGITLYEYKEDIVKPGVLVKKMCSGQVKVTDEDLQKAYQAAYGEKVDCRLIMWPPTESRIALREYQEIRNSPDGFDRKARSQANPGLAASGGRVTPISRYSNLPPEVEKEAFSLKPGELSKVIETKDSIVLLKCDALVPADTKVKFEDVRETLRKEVFERKLNDEMTTFFTLLRNEAKPVFILKKPLSADDLTRSVEQELGIQQTGATAPAIKK